MRIGPFETGQVFPGDCLELLPAIPDGSVPFIWTDPPYGVEQNDGKNLAVRWEGAFGWRLGKGVYAEGRPIANDGRVGFEALMRAFLAQAGRVLSPDESALAMCVVGGGGAAGPIFARIADWLDVPPLEFFHAVIWDKLGLGMGLRYRRNYEFVYIAKRRGSRLLWADPKRCDEKTANVVRMNRIIPRADDHPTPKPVELVEHFLELHTKPGDLVLDPFAGAGTTGVACARMGREFLGFELDQRWVDLANKRIRLVETGARPDEQANGQQTFFDLFPEWTNENDHEERPRQASQEG